MSQLLEEQLRLWRDELATVDRGVRESAFTPPAALDDFSLRFTALLDGLAILRLRQMHQPSRKRLIDLAMATARAELAGGTAAPATAPADPASPPAAPPRRAPAKRATAALTQPSSPVRL